MILIVDRTLSISTSLNGISFEEPSLAFFNMRVDLIIRTCGHFCDRNSHMKTCCNCSLDFGCRVCTQRKDTQ